MCPDAAHDRSQDGQSHARALEAVSELLRLLTSANQTASAKGRESEPGAPRYTEILRLGGQVMLACAASSFRFWGRSAEIWGKAFPLMMETLTVANGRPKDGVAETSTALDEIRAVLRELTEVPGQESRRLQAELEQIVLGNAPPGAPESPPDAADAYWRRWEAKP
jgi:hypothetical protein